LANGDYAELVQGKVGRPLALNEYDNGVELHSMTTSASDSVLGDNREEL